MFDYHDGVLGGVAACDVCRNEYVFRVQAWEPEEDVRVFELRPVAAGVFNKVVEICSALGPARWPVWVLKWQFSTEAEEHRAAAQLDALLEPQDTSRLFLASRALEKEILGVRYVDQDVLFPSLADWLRWLQPS